ncbi:mRNA-capping enzyme subunit beta [Zygosaccharomyces mellis]|uniref:mRNA-capping enzyme subunit beta n=1 Tax=Zygosaccharomyces mellis TaxID=42258 RepID=A0A4C2EAB0_9SACH|nr:mRNA-capping enzyme subunit beta [Zygosaccharomyces mellis]
MMSQDQKPVPKRALSLDDLVNHDDDAHKVRKTTEDSIVENNSDETDTDDGDGKDGGVDFNSEMDFDYDKQEQPAKDSNASSSVNTIFDEKASLQSKKNNIKQDLRVLNEIAATSKPNKYKNAPIWAQKWKPTVKALQSIDTKDFKIDTSFLNLIPDDDLTKSVQDWVYATIFSIPPDLRPMVEMELKYGVIIDAKSPDRISPPVSTQAIYTEDGRMTPNVDQAVFEELKKYIHGISELNENSGKFSVIESQTTDSLYRVGVATQRPRFLRMSTDLKTGRVAQFIEKRKISSLLIFSPKDSYDMKLSINLEIPVPENEPPEKYKDQTPMSARTKKRVSYIHNDSCTRIDVTDVERLQKGPKGRDTNDNTFEVELEINTAALLNSFDNITTDSNLYASLIRTFLNNGTLIRRKMSSISYDIFEGQKKGM